MAIAIRQVPSSEARHLRSHYEAEAACQIVYDSIHRRPGWTHTYLIDVDGIAAGFATIAIGGPWQGTPTLLEFYLAPDTRGRAFELFEGLLDASGVRLFSAQTSNSVYAAMVHTYGRDISSEKIVFCDGAATSLPSHGATLTRVTPEGEAMECFRRRDGGSEWTLELDGRTAASGGILFHYNHPYGDIYMEVTEDSRRRGLGAYLVQELKRVTYEMGGIPAARCDPSNVPSRRTLQKAGLVPYAHLLNGTFTGPSAVGS